MNIRQKNLFEKLQKSGRVLIDDESRHFGVSAMTIRRDLQFLEDTGLAVRTHGGAIPRVETNNQLTTLTAATDAQKRIAKEVVKLIKPGSTIMISVGTTTLQIARELVASGMQLSVVTNSLPIAAALFQSKVKVLLTGGFLRDQSMDLVGPVAEKNLSEFYIDILITGCDGAVSDIGFFTSDLNLATMERKTVEVSEQVIVVTESHKFQKKAFTKFASLDDVSTVITDSSLQELDYQRLKAHDIQVILA